MGLGGLGGGVGEGNWVRMSGLPYSATDNEIKSFVGQAQLTPARLHRSPNGGEAFVLFGTEAEARIALGLHKQYLGSRYVDVALASAAEVMVTVGAPASAESRMGALGSLGGLGGLGGYAPMMYGYGGYGFQG
mmetsp:Transcript_5367/g.8431  ORF Transcript_5367/g.8431 Transcript_5367/m.8431 type:complete len:133 (+) Transcript_5367:3-401(+)